MSANPSAAQPWESENAAARRGQLDALRVCHVVPDLDRVGGYEGQALTLARQQRAAGVRSEIVTHHMPGPTGFHVAEPGVPVHRLPPHWLGARPSPWWHRQDASPHIVHAHALHRLSGQMVQMARRAGVATVVKVATAGDVAEFARGRKRGLREAARQRLRQVAFDRLRQADAVVAISDQIAAELKDEGVFCIRLPNGVDTDRFRPPTPGERAEARAAWDVSDETLCLSFVGRLAERKDLGTLIRSLGRFHPKQPWCLLVAGEGAEHSTLVVKAAELGVAHRIRFLGELADVGQVLRAADLFVHPSLLEGAPNSVLEAWACGVPTVLSGIPGHVELPGVERAGWFFAPGDPDDLAARLEHVALDPSARACAASGARRAAESHFAIRDVAARYLDLYRELLERRR